ncbi:MAG: hypothetical protein H6727_06025 [Myxococcales bacterium]|nr:hypothetical protein [Myxococcales bacterium]
MQEQRYSNPWWFLQPLEHPPSIHTPEAPLHRALKVLLQEPPLDHQDGPSEASTLETKHPLPPLLPYLQTMRDLMQQLEKERARAPQKLVEYSQRLHDALQHLRRAFLAVEQELRWLSPQHPLLATLEHLLQDLHRDLQHTQVFLHKHTDHAPLSADLYPLKTLDEEDFQPPMASTTGTLYGTPLPKTEQHTSPHVDVLEELDPSSEPLSPEEVQQTLLSLQQSSKSGVRLNIPGYEPPPPTKAETFSGVKVDSPTKKTESSKADNKLIAKRESSAQAELSLVPPPSSAKSKAKDIPATIARIQGRIEQVTDTSSFRCAINELEQATHIIPDASWDELCEDLCVRSQKAQVEVEEWEKFPSCRMFWQKRNSASSSRFENPHPTEPPDSKYRGRFRDLLNDTFFSMYRRLVDDVCGTPMSYIDQHSEEERYLMLTVWSARARWVQDQLPEEEFSVQSFLRNLFGRINSARKEHIGNKYWIEPLNRRFFADWPGYISEHEQKLQELREEQHSQQLALSEQEDRIWQQEMRVYIWLSKLRKSIRALPEGTNPEAPETQAFLGLLREILDDEMNPSDTDLLELIEPYEELIQSGGEFRHLRRHLRKLKEQSPEERAVYDQEDFALIDEEASRESQEDDEDEAYSHLLQRRRNAKKLRTVLPLVRERHAVIIGGDEREQARERLETMLQLKNLEWIPREGGNPRVLDRLEERIASGKVTLVLLLIRFIGHDTSRIIQACKRANALWVPIDHGYGESRILHSLSYYLLEQDRPSEN